MDMAPSDPLGTMDARLLGQTLGESYRVLRRIGADNRAVLLTTHNLDRALEWSDSVSILVDGKIAFTEASRAMTGAQLRHSYDEVSMTA